VVNALALELFARSGPAAALARAFTGVSSTFGFLSRASSWAAALAAELAILNNYLWNSAWTFRSYQARRWSRFLGNLAKFNLTSFGAILLQFVCVGLATFVVAETTAVRQVALVLTVALVIVPYNWLMYNRVVWKTQGAGEQGPR